MLKNLTTDWLIKCSSICEAKIIATVSGILTAEFAVALPRNGTLKKQDSLIRKAIQIAFDSS
jgi:hypothetical protein